MATKKKDLFDDDASSSSSSSSDDGSSTSLSSSSAAAKGSSGDGSELRLTVNKSFATRYQNKKEREELQQIRQQRQRDGIADGDSSESDSSDEEEDEDGVLFTPSANVQFLKTIKALRKKDDSIYDPKAQFFDELVGDGDNDNDEGKKATRKPQRYKDVVRDHILEQMEEDERGSGGDAVAKGPSGDPLAPRSKLGYDAEQEKLRAAFLTESSNADGGDNEDDWMVVKKKAETPAEIEKLEQEASKELKEIEKMSKKSKKKTGSGEDDVFKDPRGEVGDGEKFLLDFITNKKWIDHNDLDRNASDGDDNEESSLDDVERADEYESNYNFRFEQAAQETAASGASLSVQTYARSQTMNTVRREDTSRKDKRQARKERKAAERKAKEDQLKRLKNAKKKEMNQKLSQVKAVIGGVDESVIDEAEIMQMLEGDYDPEKFEKAMEKAYGEDFYQQEDKEWKSDLDVRKTLKGDEEGDELVGQDDLNGGMYDNVQDGEANEDAMDDPDYDEDAEWDETEYDESHEESKLEKKLKTKMQEELYKLDYEDIVAGMPTRFKYRQVESNDYGLTTQEILFARDRTLKQFVSLKKMAPYNEQGEHFVGSKKRRKFRELLKKDLEEALPKKEESQQKLEANHEPDPVQPEPKKKRRRLKKGKKSKENAENNDKTPETSKPESEIQTENAGGSKKRRRKKGGKKGDTKDTTGSNKTDEPTKPVEKSDETSGGANIVREVASKKRRSSSKTPSSDDKHKKKKKKKAKDKKSSIAGISQSRLASYGL